MAAMSLEQIRANSAEITRLTRRIKETCRARGPEWHAACEEFHRRYDELSFPGGTAMLDRVRSRDRTPVENAVRFLEADPMHFGSGYLKEYLWRWLRRMDLSTAKIQRLEMTAFGYCDRTVSREFWEMGKAMHFLATPSFWVQVAVMVGRDGPSAPRALYLLSHGPSVHSGATIRRQVYRAWLQKNYGGA